MSRATSTSREIALPITYTPTTHRISKAKKGKRVHACEFPGCTKVFTRAEHRRRHELNHNPEARYQCSNPACKKAFHRPDLLARHMERHELEAQMDNTRWDRQTRVPMIPSYAHKHASIDPTSSPYMDVTSSMSIGSVMGPAIHHPELSNDYGLTWNGIEMHSEHQTPVYPSHHIHESVEDHCFYSTPETCPSPGSDGATLSIPSHPRSSVASTPVAFADHYPESILDSELTSSPLPLSAHLGHWDQHDPSLAQSSIGALSSLDESLFHQHPLPCHYQSPSWPTSHNLSYDESQLQPQPSAHYQPEHWKTWPL